MADKEKTLAEDKSAFYNAHVINLNSTIAEKAITYPGEDSDGDKIINKDDICPGVNGFPNETANGCPDSDKDGFYEQIPEKAKQYIYRDECPNARGPNHGCPLPTSEPNQSPKAIDPLEPTVNSTGISKTIKQQEWESCLGGKDRTGLQAADIGIDPDLPQQKTTLGRICNGRQPSEPDICTQYIKCVDGTFRFSICKCKTITGYDASKSKSEKKEQAINCIKDSIGAVAANLQNVIELEVKANQSSDLNTTTK